MNRLIIPALAAGVLTVAACTSAHPVTHSAAGPTASPLPSTAHPTAEQIATRMGLTYTAYNATTDPNHLLGRQGEYTSKINWGPNLDNSIEVFPNLADEQARLQYLQGFRAPFGDGYDYPADDSILRLDDLWTPSQAHAEEVKFVLALAGKSSPPSSTPASPSSSPSPSAAAITTPAQTAASLYCKVEQDSSGLEYTAQATVTGGSAYVGNVSISFYSSVQGQTFPGTELSPDVTVTPDDPWVTWQSVPADDIGASAEPVGCAASDG